MAPIRLNPFSPSYCFHHRLYFTACLKEALTKNKFQTEAQFVAHDEGSRATRMIDELLKTGPPIPLPNFIVDAIGAYRAQKAARAQEHLPAPGGPEVGSFTPAFNPLPLRFRIPPVF